MTPLRRRAVLGLGALLGLAALPRLTDIGHPSLTYDEHYDYADSLRFCERGRATQPISDGYLNGQLPFFAACPLYRLLGADERAARALSAIAGLGAVSMTWLLARRFLGRRPAFAAALLMAVSPFAISSSRLAFSHGHGLHVPLVLVGLYAASRASARRARIRSGFSGLALGAAAGTDLLALLWGPIFLLLLARRLWRAAARIRTHAAFAFVGGAVLGLAVASPMIVARPAEALSDIVKRLDQWDGVTGHLWLGRTEATIPWSYYLLVAAVKLGPLTLPPILLALAHATRRGGARPRFLFYSLWPVVLLSIKPWKSPFYLAAFVPVLYLLAAHGLSRLLRRRPFAGRRWLRGVLLALVVLPEAGRALLFHPDYSMLGIDYSERLFGDFQGPAVSHGQWVGEAIVFVRRDWDGAREPNVLVFGGFASEQVMSYARRERLASVFDGSQIRERGIGHDEIDYLIVNQDCLRHPEEGRINRLLLRLAADRAAFRPAATFRSGPLPMVWVYRRAAYGLRARER